MRQLSGHDASFLYADTTHSNANVSLLHIYDQSTAPGGVLRFKTILAHVERRLERSPVFRQKLLRVPFALDHPYWVDDENFDLEYHVRHIALPKPGDWRQFCIQVSRLHARALDLSRPPWEIYVIEGLDSFLDLPPGSFALLTKTHLAAVDVKHGGELTTLLHDASAEPPAPAPPAPWFPDPPPGLLSLLCRGAVNTLSAPWRMAAPLGRALAQVAPAAFTLAGDLLMHPQNLPATRFNSVVSPHRVFETRRFLLSEFKAIRSLVPGASVNDAVLAVCGGALRRYLEPEGELPAAASLSAIAPFYIRDADDPGGERRDFSFAHVQLGTQIADPVERLAAVAQQTRSSDTVARAVGARELSEIGQQASAAALAITSKMLGRAALGLGRRSPLANCTITNVPGPTQPMYLCGARMTYFSAILPIADGMGLAFAVTSYDGRLVISPTSCRELMPDPENFAQCLRDSFQEYLALAGGGRVVTAAPGEAKTQAVRKRAPRAAAKSPAKAAAALAGAAVKPRRARSSAAGRTSRSGPRA